MQGACVCLLAMSVYVIGTVVLRADPPPVPVVANDADIATPARLRIPRLGIDAPVIPVGVDAKGNMAVPARPEDVGWFAPGALPGQSGSAVFAGHLDTVLRTRGVFWNLHLLQPGDEIQVETGSGQTLHFRVISSRTYPYDRAPLQEIFSASGARLVNLITCNGTWEGATYERRLVVSAAFVQDDGTRHPPVVRMPRS